MEKLLRTSCDTLPHCLGTVGSASASMHRPNAWGQWAVDLLQYTASLPGGRGQWISCNTLPHCLGAVGSGLPATDCLTAWGQWAVGILQFTASLPEGSERSASCNTLPHCPGAAGSEPPALHTAVDLLRCTAALPGGSGQWTSCNAMSHCLGAVGSGPPATHCLTAWGQWAVDGSEAVYCRRSTAQCPQAVRQCIARGPLPTAPRPPMILAAVFPQNSKSCIFRTAISNCTPWCCWVYVFSKF